MAFLVSAEAPLSLRRLAVPAVCVLMGFLSIGPQILFARSPDLLPGPLSAAETYLFNALLLGLWWSYYKTCTVDPGRYTFPPRPSSSSKPPRGADHDHDKAGHDDDDDDDDDDRDGGGDPDAAAGGTAGKKAKRRRWCRKCDRPKPPRAHHCKVCGRCIPRMDHHCPWTSNCVSLQTFPHFLRFLGYANVALWDLLYQLWRRFGALWARRHLPSYLGPSPAQLVALTIFTLVAGVSAFVMGLLLATTLKGWVFNTTMIETWEIERHEALQARRPGTADDRFWAPSDPDPDGAASASASALAIEPVEFPYDVGFFANMAQAMGSRNPLLWFLPFAPGPTVAANRDGRCRGSGWEYEENGLNDREDMWPPVDPARVRQARAWRDRRRRAAEQAERAAFEEDAARGASPAAQREAFRRRQERDMQRWRRQQQGQQQGRILGELEEVGDGGYEFVDGEDDDDAGEGVGMVGAPRVGMSGWVNAEGEQLGDYGVDEDAESDGVDGEGESDDGVIDVDSIPEDDDVPLAELIRRRKVLTRDGEPA